MPTARAPFPGCEERLRLLELQVERLIAHCESERGTQTRVWAAAETRLDGLEHSIYGNAQPGLQTRMQVLEEDRKGRWRLQGPVWAACLAVLAKAVWDVVSLHK